LESKEQDRGQPWNPLDEENLLMELNEDRWLRRLGIDPDGISWDIVMELKRMKDEGDRGREQGPSPRSSANAARLLLISEPAFSVVANRPMHVSRSERLETRICDHALTEIRGSSDGFG
jgi:hypothetical protein